MVFDPVDAAAGATVPASIVCAPPPRVLRRAILLTVRQAVATRRAEEDWATDWSLRLIRNRVLSMRPWKIGTPISMHFSITSRRSRPASRASSVGVRWIAISTVLLVRFALTRKVPRASDGLNGDRSTGDKPSRSDGIGDVREDVLDPERLGQVLAEAADAERLRGVVARGDEVDPRLARVGHHVLGGLAGEEGVEAQRDGLRQELGGRARDDPDAAHPLGARVEDERLPARHLPHAREQVRGGDAVPGELAEPADLLEGLVAGAAETLGEL